VFGGDFLHHSNCGALWHSLGQFIPARILLGTEVWSIEKLLQAQDVRFFSRSLLNQLKVLVDHRFSDLGERAFRA
jgi:hypothetical protein